MIDGETNTAAASACTSSTLASEPAAESDERAGQARPRRSRRTAAARSGTGSSRRRRARRTRVRRSITAIAIVLTTTTAPSRRASAVMMIAASLMHAAVGVDAQPRWVSERERAGASGALTARRSLRRCTPGAIRWHDADLPGAENRCVKASGRRRRLPRGRCQSGRTLRSAAWGRRSAIAARRQVRRPGCPNPDHQRVRRCLALRSEAAGVRGSCEPRAEHEIEGRRRRRSPRSGAARLQDAGRHR